VPAGATLAELIDAYARHLLALAAARAGARRVPADRLAARAVAALAIAQAITIDLHSERSAVVRDAPGPRCRARRGGRRRRDAPGRRGGRAARENRPHGRRQPGSLEPCRSITASTDTNSCSTTSRRLSCTPSSKFFASGPTV
jgi:hypothetical protein